MLFCPDEGDRWDDEETWRKVNPNLGVSLSLDYMRSECEEARLRGGTYLVAFQTKNLNMWVDAPEVWVSDDDIAANNAAFDESQLEGAECYVGIDLASKGDLTATALFFPRFNVVKYFITIPEAKLIDKGVQDDIVDYRRWQEQGWITVCPGPVLDEEWWMERLFLELARYTVRCIAFDPWGMWDLKNRFGKYTPLLMEYQQSIRFRSVPTKDMESRLRRHELNFLGNPVIRWMFRNVVVYVDPNANIKLDKARSRNKIDGVVALVDALGGYLTKTAGKRPAYSDHTLRSIKL
jgi:phage terminase large subunit-like protein